MPQQAVITASPRRHEHRAQPTPPVLAPSGSLMMRLQAQPCRKVSMPHATTAAGRHTMPFIGSPMPQMKVTPSRTSTAYTRRSRSYRRSAQQSRDFNAATAPNTTRAPMSYRTADTPTHCRARDFLGARTTTFHDFLSRTRQYCKRRTDIMVSRPPIDALMTPNAINAACCRVATSPCRGG